MQFIFGGQPQQSGVQWPPRGPENYQPQNLVYGNSPWYGGAGASATDPSSVPGYQGPPGPGGTQGGVKGPNGNPNPYPGQQSNPFDFTGTQPALAPQPQGGVTITTSPTGGQTVTVPPPSPQASGVAAGAPPPVVAPPPPPVAPPPEPVNEWGRTAQQQKDWQAQMDYEAMVREDAQKEQDAAAATQAQLTQDAFNQDELMKQGLAGFNQWVATERLKQAELRRQWEQHFAAVEAMPTPDWNSLPVFQILNNLQDPAAFQARGKAEGAALAGPTMPQAPQMPMGPDFYPLNDWTLQEDPATRAMIQAAMQELNQGYSDINHFVTTGAPMPKPIKLNLPDAHKVNWHDFASLLPSERAVLESGIRSQGQTPEDYFAAMERSTPRGRGFSGTGWG